MNTKTTIKLKADKRTTFGRKVKQMRQKGILPINLYGKKIKSIALQTPVTDFTKIFAKTGESQLVELMILPDQKTRHALINNVQKDPVTGAVLHADFRQVDLTEKIEAEITIELKGESPAINKGGVLVQTVNSLRVEALPADLPEKFTIDISGLAEVGDSIVLKQLQYDQAKVKLIDEDENKLLVKIDTPTKEEVKPVEAETAEADEAGESKEGEAKPEAGKDKDIDKKNQPETAGEDKKTAVKTEDNKDK